MSDSEARVIDVKRDLNGRFVDGNFSWSYKFVKPKTTGRTYFKKGVKPPIHNSNCSCFRCKPITTYNNISMIEYRQLHTWGRKNKYKPKECSWCSKVTEKLDLANLARDYRWNLAQYEYLCKSCHKRYDTNKSISFKNIVANRNGEVPW